MEKAKVLTDEQIIKWMGENNKIGSQWFHRCEAQRDADHEHYLTEFSKAFSEEAILNQLVQTCRHVDYCGKMCDKTQQKDCWEHEAKAILNLIDDKCPACEGTGVPRGTSTEGTPCPVCNGKGKRS